MKTIKPLTVYAGIYTPYGKHDSYFSGFDIYSSDPNDMIAVLQENARINDGTISIYRFYNWDDFDEINKLATEMGGLDYDAIAEIEIKDDNISCIYQNETFNWEKLIKDYMGKI